MWFFEDADTQEEIRYEEFVDKFRPKKTTDDCYTPNAIYEAVAGFVETQYRVKRESFVRPFWPGMDFRSRHYKPGEVVVDNPPFSIFSKITRFYAERAIPFFIFGPTLTLFSADERVCVLPCGVSITYGNGAVVNTSFATNLEPAGLRIATRPELYKAVEAADREMKSGKREVGKYSRPENLLTAAMAYNWARWGVTVEIRREECRKVHELDAMRAEGRGIFGHGYLISQEAAGRKAEAERIAEERQEAAQAKARRWELSGREMEIIRALSRK